MEDFDCHRRSEDREVQSKSSDQKQHHQNCAQIPPAPDVMEPLEKSSAAPCGPDVRMQFRDAEEGHGDEHSGERNTVDYKRPARSYLRDDEAGNGRADHPAGIERRRIEGDGIMEMFVTDQFRDEGLAHGSVKGGGGTRQKRKNVDMPKLDDAGDGEDSQSQGADAHR